jgi:hypothetical protein
MADAVDRLLPDALDPALPAGTIFPAHTRYRFYFAGSVGLALLFVWDLVQGAGVEFLFFAGIALVAALWSARMMASRVELTRVGVTLHMPFAELRHVDFRQLFSASEEGRFNRVITLIYYPVAADGLLDLQDARTLFLPAVEEQERLMAAILREMPR